MGDGESLARRAQRRLGAALHPQVEVAPPPDGVQVDWDVPVVVRDGTTLRVNVFRPPASDATPVPVIMSAHPYGKDKIPARSRSGAAVNLQYRIMPQPDVVRFSAWTGWEAPDPAFWVPRGYAVVNADGRGGGTSEGVAELFSDQEAQDYYDLVEWAGTQPWSTGKVGLDGVSYLAISQYKVAALQPPHLAAICPWEGFSDLYRDFARPGGIREVGFLVVWSKGTRLGARVNGNLRGEVVARPERDEWYRARTPDLERIKVPVLVCGSFSDHNLHGRGSFEVFRRAGSTRKWLYTHRSGKWSHYYSAEASQTRAQFFDHFLKDEDNGWDARPPVRLAVHERGPTPVQVSQESAWPPQDLTWTRLTLDATDLTLRTGPQPGPASIRFATHGHGTQLTWTVPHDMDVIGPMAARLHVEAQGCDDVHLFVGLRAFRSDLESVFEGSFGFDHDMVSTGWQRAAFRTLDPSLSTPEYPVHTFVAPEPLRPGQIVAVDVAMREHATRLRAGDRLRLVIRGTWHYPRDPVRGQLPSGYQKSPRGTCILHTGADLDSHLLLGWRAVAPTPSGIVQPLPGRAG